MDTKKTLKKRVWGKSIALISVLIVATCVFSTKTIAQSKVNAPNVSVSISNSVLPQNDKLEALFKSDATFAVRYKEYNEIIERYVVERDERKIYNLSSITEDDMNMLKKLFLSMSSEQQSVLNYTFQRKSVAAERKPAKEEFELWKEPSEYGIWLDGKRIENSELNQYQHTDFSLYYVSRLARNAKNYGKHVYQLDLTTTAVYMEQKARAEDDETLYLMPNFKRGN